MNQSLPRLVFFCELPSAALVSLFADGSVIDDLRALNAVVSLAIIDLSAERAAVVRQLNEAEIPTVAWQLLPKAQGYYFNVDNPLHAAAFYRDFRHWTDANALRWAGIGLDVEPDLREMEMYVDAQLGRVLRKIPARLFDAGAVRRAQAIYGALIGEMRGDGYAVESYQFPFIVDERAVRSTLLQRLFRIVDVPVDREMLMLYSSMEKMGGGDLGGGMLWSYAPDAQVIAVGSTGGGEEIPPLAWEELARDLRLARRWVDTIAVHSLEGCVEKGFLTRLRTLDWDERVVLPLRGARQVEGYRRVLRAILWSSAHPELVLGALIAALALGGLWKRKRT